MKILFYTVDIRNVLATASDMLVLPHSFSSGSTPPVRLNILFQTLTPVSAVLIFLCVCKDEMERQTDKQAGRQADRQREEKREKGKTETIVLSSPVGGMTFLWP